MPTTPSAPLLTLVGFGPGLGLGLARTFGAAGYRLALLARTPAKSVDALAQLRAAGLTAETFAADAGHADSLNAALASVAARCGATDVLIYNAISLNFGPPTSMTPASLAADFSVNVTGALTATLAVLPEMRTKKSGVILFTGGGWALYPGVDAASASIGKAALRSLAFTLAEELKPSGIRAGTVTIMGQIAAGTPFDPEKIARAYLDYARQPAGSFAPELTFRGA